MNKVIKFIASLTIPQLAGLIGSIFTIDNVRTWYPLLNKPVFNPPSWIFGPVWTTLYTLMGIALFMVWNRGLNNKNNRLFFNVFMVQIILNAIWSIAFFGARDPFMALIIIAILLSLIIYMLVIAYRIDRKIAYLIWPYVLWVSFASVLNFSIYIAN